MARKMMLRIFAGVKIRKIGILSLLFLMGCIAQSKEGRIPPHQWYKLPDPNIVSQSSRPHGSSIFEIKIVKVEPRKFNPGKGEVTVIHYLLSRPGSAIIKIFDPEMRLVKDIICRENVSGSINEINELVWDGKDNEGRVVPDEAYSFYAEALDRRGNFTLYDPSIASGEHINLKVRFLPEDNALFYELPEDGRVVIRAGIKDGVLLDNIVNYRPRLAGMNKEPWDGIDGPGVKDLVNQKEFSLMAEAVTLPENCVLTYGNLDYTYYEYKTAIAPDRPLKKDRPLLKKRNPLVQRFVTVPGEFFPEPKFSLLLPQNINIHENGLPVVNGTIPIKIILDERLKTAITEQRYEIISFVDLQFITEEECGYSPYTWMWDTRKVSNGEHILTINICTLKGGMASNSIRIMVKN